MTAEQLIAILQKMPQEKEVKIEMLAPGFHEIHEIEKVENFENTPIRLVWVY